jgi:hypothetical protein
MDHKSLCQIDPIRGQARSHKDCANGLLWRGSLLPLERVAVPKPVTEFYLTKLGCRIYDCCAAEREQAPSPQVIGFN